MESSNKSLTDMKCTNVKFCRDGESVENNTRDPSLINSLSPMSIRQVGTFDQNGNIDKDDGYDNKSSVTNNIVQNGQANNCDVYNDVNNMHINALKCKSNYSSRSQGENTKQNTLTHLNKRFTNSVYVQTTENVPFHSNNKESQSCRTESSHSSWPRLLFTWNPYAGQLVENNNEVKEEKSNSINTFHMSYANNDRINCNNNNNTNGSLAHNYANNCGENNICKVINTNKVNIKSYCFHHQLERFQEQSQSQLQSQQEPQEQRKCNTYETLNSNSNNNVNIVNTKGKLYKKAEISLNNICKGNENTTSYSSASQCLNECCRDNTFISTNCVNGINEENGVLCPELLYSQPQPPNMLSKHMEIDQLSPVLPNENDTSSFTFAKPSNLTKPRQFAEHVLVNNAACNRLQSTMSNSMRTLQKLETCIADGRQYYLDYSTNAASLSKNNNHTNTVDQVTAQPIQQKMSHNYVSPSSVTPSPMSTSLSQKKIQQTNSVSRVSMSANTPSHTSTSTSLSTSLAPIKINTEHTNVKFSTRNHIVQQEHKNDSVSNVCQSNHNGRITKHNSFILDDIIYYTEHNLIAEMRVGVYPDLRIDDHTPAVLTVLQTRPSTFVTRMLPPPPLLSTFVLTTTNASAIRAACLRWLTHVNASLKGQKRQRDQGNLSNTDNIVNGTLDMNKVVTNDDNVQSFVELESINDRDLHTNQEYHQLEEEEQQYEQQQQQQEETSQSELEEKQYNQEELEKEDHFAQLNNTTPLQAITCINSNKTETWQNEEEECYSFRKSMCNEPVFVTPTSTNTSVKDYIESCPPLPANNDALVHWSIEAMRWWQSIVQQTLPNEKNNAICATNKKNKINFTNPHYNINNNYYYNNNYNINIDADGNNINKINEDNTISDTIVAGINAVLQAKRKSHANDKYWQSNGNGSDNMYDKMHNFTLETYAKLNNISNYNINNCNCSNNVIHNNVVSTNKHNVYSYTDQNSNYATNYGNISSFQQFNGNNQQQSYYEYLPNNNNNNNNIENTYFNNGESYGTHNHIMEAPHDGYIYDRYNESTKIFLQDNNNFMIMTSNNNNNNNDNDTMIELSEDDICVY